jgi:hypothetical protein
MANSTGLILGVSGLAGSGKDTTADTLVGDHGFVKVSLADPLKRIVRDVYAFTDEQLWGPSQFRNAEDPRYQRDDGSFLSPREALQKLGTEWGRECYPNTWVALCMRTAQLLLASPDVMGLKFRPLTYTFKEGLREVDASDVRGVVIPDVRFKNEIAAIKAAGGKVIRIVRPGAGLGGAAGIHVSEMEQASIPDSEFDHVIQNTGTLEELRRAIEEFIQ